MNFKKVASYIQLYITTCQFNSTVNHAFSVNLWVGSPTEVLLRGEEEMVVINIDISLKKIVSIRERSGSCLSSRRREEDGTYHLESLCPYSCGFWEVKFPTLSGV